MLRRSSSRPPLLVWARLATWLSFLAVAAALWAPVSMLAHDVRTGKLGGVCSVNIFDAATGDANAASASSAASDGDAAQPGFHCDLCSPLALLVPALAPAAAACLAGHEVITADVSAATSAAIAGLPFSRGPPAL